MSDGIDGSKGITNCKLCRHWKSGDWGDKEQCFIRAGYPSEGFVYCFCISFEKSHVRQATTLKGGAVSH